MRAEDRSDAPFMSVIVPAHDSAATLDACLGALDRYRDGSVEVVVVDDRSTDGTGDIIRRYGVRTERLEGSGGASRARNAGAALAGGDVLFFIDSDCVVRPDTLRIAAREARRHADAVVGGTYTPLPHDRSFFSVFQSVFINHAETKSSEPDYVATHAMVIRREVFLQSGGFDESFMPILEDVEFSHRLRRSGVRLLMCPELLVEHIFNFTLVRSLKNAFRKSFYWTRYSLANRDLLADSGTASLGLKSATAAWPLTAAMVSLALWGGSWFPLAAAAVIFGLTLLVNRRLLAALVRAGGKRFGALAVLYYTGLYPLAVGAGGLAALLRGR